MRHDQPNREPNPEFGLTIRLFGGMAIHDSSGVDYLPRSRKTRAIVALLALAAPKSALRGAFTALLWSKRGPEQGRASLRQAVHELQGTLGSVWKHILVAERHCLTFDLYGVTVDALAATAPAAPSTELLRLFEHGFLEELAGLDPAFDIWLAKERRRLVAIARVGGEAFLEEWHGREVIVLAARSLLRLDPANDPAWRALIEAHIQSGDRAAARFACEQWGETMHLGPDEVPSAELAGFLSRIRFGPVYRPEHGGRGVALAEGVAEQVIPPDGSLSDRSMSDRGPSEQVKPDGVPPDGVPPYAVMQNTGQRGAARPDHAALNGVPSENAMPKRAVPDGVVTDGACSGEATPVVPVSTIPGGERNETIPGVAMPGRASADAASLFLTSGGVRLARHDEPGDATGNGVAEDPVVPAPAMPRRAMPNGDRPDGDRPDWDRPDGDRPEESGPEAGQTTRDLADWNAPASPRQTRSRRPKSWSASCCPTGPEPD